jgi:LacI family transcriptional regulator
MVAAGIPVATPVLQTNGTKEAALWDTTRIRKDYEALIEQAFSGSDPPDGIFAPTDQQVAMVHQLLRERGLIPGKDVRTVSCNNDRQWLATLHPQPATIDLRAGTLGREAVQRLSWRMDHPQSDPTVIMVAPRLVEAEEI